MGAEGTESHRQNYHYPNNRTHAEEVGKDRSSHKRSHSDRQNDSRVETSSSRDKKRSRQHDQNDSKPRSKSKERRTERRDEETKSKHSKSSNSHSHHTHQPESRSRSSRGSSSRRHEKEFHSSSLSSKKEHKAHRSRSSTHKDKRSSSHNHHSSSQRSRSRGDERSKTSSHSREHSHHHSSRSSHRKRSHTSSHRHSKAEPKKSQKTDKSAQSSTDVSDPKIETTEADGQSQFQKESSELDCVSKSEEKKADDTLAEPTAQTKHTAEVISMKQFFIQPEKMSPKDSTDSKSFHEINGHEVDNQRASEALEAEDSSKLEQEQQLTPVQNVNVDQVNANVDQVNIQHSETAAQERVEGDANEDSVRKEIGTAEETIHSVSAPAKTVYLSERLTLSETTQEIKVESRTEELESKTSPRVPILEPTAPAEQVKEQSSLLNRISQLSNKIAAGLAAAQVQGKITKEGEDPLPSQEQSTEGPAAAKSQATLSCESKADNSSLGKFIIEHRRVLEHQEQEEEHSDDENNREEESANFPSSFSPPSKPSPDPGENKKEVVDMFSDEFDASLLLESHLNDNAKHQQQIALLQEDEADLPPPELRDDAEGYYTFRVNDVLGKRYRAASVLGRGVFSCVLKCEDLLNPSQFVAVKVVRNNDMMARCGEKEREVLKLLCAKDPDRKKHCITLLDSFVHLNHLCLVLEAEHLNLRKVIRQFGQGRGLSLQAVQSYGKQMLVALKHMHRCNVVHADLKPDNMVVDSTFKSVKVCDFGSAYYFHQASEYNTTPYMVSRYYRAPEIPLGLDRGPLIDVWSVGCTMFELYTGKVLFSGTSNNALLKHIFDYRGAPPRKLLKQSPFFNDHFDGDFNFLCRENDTVTGKVVIRPKPLSHKPRELMLALLPPKSVRKVPESERNQVLILKDFLEKALSCDPLRRPSAEQLLKHPFFKLEITKASK